MDRIRASQQFNQSSDGSSPAGHTGKQHGNFTGALRSDYRAAVGTIKRPKHRVE
jgi:hypothetical protein